MVGLVETMSFRYLFFFIKQDTMEKKYFLFGKLKLLFVNFEIIIRITDNL